MLRDKDPRFKNLEIKTGIMLGAALAGIIVILILIGIEKDVFTKKYRVYFVSPSGAGFNEGMPVKLSGFKIGRVKDMELTDDARVKITMEINSRYGLREGAKAGLSKEGFIGDSYIDVTKGSPAGRPLGEGAMIPYERAGGVEELVESAKPILSEVRDIIHYVNDPEGDMKALLGNMRELTTELRETRLAFDETITKSGALIDNLDKRSAPVLLSAERAMRNLEGASSRIEPVLLRIEGITGKAEAAMEKLPATAAKIDGIAGDIKLLTGTLPDEAPRLKEMLQNADAAINDARTIANGVKKSWPVRLMVPPVKEPSLVPLDSDPGRKD